MRLRGDLTRLLIAGLSASLGVAAQDVPKRAETAQNGGAVAADTTPKYNAGLNGRVKPVEAKVRAPVAQNGGEATGAACVQPKYNSARSGRAGAATTMAQSEKDTKTVE